MQNIRPPSALVQRQFMPKIRSRQSNLSPISVTDDAFGGSNSSLKHWVLLFLFTSTAFSSFDQFIKLSFFFVLDRFAMEPDLQLTSDLERDLEIRQIQVCLAKVFFSFLIQ